MKGEDDYAQTTRKSVQVEDFELNDFDDSTAFPLINSTLPKGGDDIHTEQAFEIDESGSELLRKTWYEGEEVVLYPANYEKVSVVRLQIATCLVLFVMFGMTDQVNGSLMPVITKYYNVTELQMSIVFFLQLMGYVSASVLNDILHKKWGSRGVMTASCILAAFTYLVLALKPYSLYLYAICFFPLGMCVGFVDSTGNFYFGNLETRKNEWMGLLHGIYGLAAGVTPPLVTTFDHYLDWSYIFWVPLVFALVGLALCMGAFKYETATKYRYICVGVPDESGGIENEEEIKWYQLSKYPPMIFLYAFFLFLYLGTEIGVGTWLFTYLLNYKKGEKFLMSFVTASFWSGITIGRLGLGFVTKRFKNEYRSSVWYGLTCSLFFFLFVIINLINSTSTFYFFVLSLMIFGAGIFIGPLFPNASVVAIQILPKHQQVSGIGTAIAFGGCGGALITYSFGFANKIFGFQYYPFLCFLGSLAFNIVWMLYPKIIKGHREYL
ncbi:Bsc6p [Kluyveromyces lactis]|uniref:KLLA0E07063p n=1 Tax=Kluyveromyces lactis (strain ATCC 8585 / CBS 2359 / DSM 70799 / NBRC 1267 / NRRL Y-1140 / WM37) TaxID=284590 RepID=Q6CP72_KLULA|nr:uncharacterized protein KLLA0_E07063g [Kluyveromyces lactis]CAG99354.1 KLLA0E07063p [Kluyveromyces lactis]|eukprot:XP_454267.1 uncharacterized protein KLLA0_E07063g [Kluyveromyces lactis]